VGILPVELTLDGLVDPVFERLPHEVCTLQWHGDTFDLPHDAVRLAWSTAYSNQAFRVRKAYGVQFHLDRCARSAERCSSAG
jgi:GMP synthase (glutamine-hydrolysing)